MPVRVLPAAGPGLALLPSTAKAGPETVKWPADRKATFTNSFNGDCRADSEEQSAVSFATVR